MPNRYGRCSECNRAGLILSAKYDGRKLCHECEQDARELDRADDYTDHDGIAR